MSKRRDTEDDAHPSQDLTNRFPLDQRLREAGFRIKARPPGGPILWDRIEAGKLVVYTQREALRLASVAAQNRKSA